MRVDEVQMALSETIRNEDKYLNSDILALLRTLWQDVSEVKSCKTCGNREKCNPEGEDCERKFWRDCGGSSKRNWTWRGVCEYEYE